MTLSSSQRARSRESDLDYEMESLTIELTEILDVDIYNQVERLTLPTVVTTIVDGRFVHELAVPILQDDDDIDDSVRRNDIRPTDTKEEYVMRLLAPGAINCSICFDNCDRRFDGPHGPRALPCDHVFGESCISNWLSIDQNSQTCPKCRVPCTLEDLRPLVSPIPDVDQATSTRRFPLCDAGFTLFCEFEAARRNVALKKLYEAKFFLDGAVRIESMYMESWVRLWGRRKAPDEEGLVRLSNKVLQKVKSIKRIAKALGQRVEAYNQRVDAYLPRLDHFTRCCHELYQFK